MSESLKNIISQIDDLKIQESYLVKEREGILRKIEEVKDETKSLEEAIVALQDNIKKGQGLKKNTLSRKQCDFQQLTEIVAELNSQVETIREQISETSKQLNTSHQKIEEILKNVSVSMRLSIDFNDGNGLQHLNINQFQSLTDTILHAIETKEFADSSKAFYEIGMLIENGSLLPLFSHSLKGMLYFLNQLCISKYSAHNEFENFTQAYKTYSSNPIEENLVNATKFMIEIFKNSFLPDGNSTAIFTESIIEIGEILCPEYTRLNKIFCTWKRNNKKNVSKSKAVYQFLQELYVWHTLSHSESAFCERYFAVAASYNYQAAVEELARRNKFKSFGVSMENGKIAPLFCGNGNPQYPTIDVGLESECSGFGKSVRIARILNFLSSDVSEFNHYVAISYDKNTKDSRETSMKVLDAVLTSVAKWCGPKGVELDVVDWDYTGLVGLCTRFQPVKEVRAVTNINKWPQEIQLLEEFMEKRSLLMYSIFDYNNENTDRKLPFRIIAIHDYDGSLIADTNAYSHRFTRLLERGYRFGIIFVICSKRGAYIPNTLTVNCSTKDFEDIAFAQQLIKAIEEVTEKKERLKIESQKRRLKPESPNKPHAISNNQLREENRRLEDKIKDLEQRLKAQGGYQNQNNDCMISVHFSCRIKMYKTVEFNEELYDIDSYNETTTMRESEFRQLILGGRKAILEFAYAQWPELHPENTTYTLSKTDTLFNKSYFDVYEKVKLTKANE